MIYCSCGSKTRVFNTFHSNGKIYRYRKCIDEKCKKKFYTVEHIITDPSEKEEYSQAAVTKTYKYQMGL